MWRLVRRAWRTAREERGQTLAVVAIGLVAIFAMAAAVLDGAMLYENRRQLQNAADGAALAGARHLYPLDAARARAEAYDYANRNGVPGSEVESIVIGTEPTYGYPIITVRTRREVSLFFARAIGIADRPVSAIATGIVTPMEPGDIWPWGTTWDLIELSRAVGEDDSLKVGARDSINGNFMAVELGGSGGNVYRDNIQYGYNGDVGDVYGWGWDIETKTGNVVGPTGHGTDYVLDLAHEEPYASYCWPDSPGWVGPDSSCPNFGLVPVLEGHTWEDISGHETVTVIGFAVFELKSYDGHGHAAVIGSFNYEHIWTSGSRHLGGPLEGAIGVSLWPSGPNLP